MNKFRLAFFAAIAAGLFSSPASAKVIDFVAEVAARGERGVADGAVLNTAEMGGLNLQFSAGVGGASRDYAYFNAATSNGSPQGLGSCKRLNSAGQCSRHYDDIVSSNEWVQVGFLDRAFNINAMSFVGGGNASLNNSLGLIKITTGLNSVLSVVTMTFAQAATNAFGLVDWVRFEFAGAEFVVAQISDIPLPGALPLLLSGLAGLGFAARRKKA
jgi:hypothetical protein